MLLSAGIVHQFGTDFYEAEVSYETFRIIVNCSILFSTLFYLHIDFLIEVEAIVNSRPFTTDLLIDVNSMIPLSPTNLLTLKSRVVMPAPGVFTAPDIYCCKHWRRVQHISNEFWSRWRKEVLAALQCRQKWNTIRRNCKVGNIVLLKEAAVERNS